MASAENPDEQYSEQVEGQLRSVGWFPGRRVNTAVAVELLTATGFGVTELAAAVLAEFGGLSWYQIPGGGILNFAFDVVSAISDLSPERLARHEPWLGCGPDSLTPFGQGDGYIALASDHDIILLGDTQSDYLTFPSLVAFLTFVLGPRDEPFRAQMPVEH